MAPSRILLTGFGALLVLYALTAAWIVVNSDTERVDAHTLRLETGGIVIERVDRTVRIEGAFRDEVEREELVDRIVDTTAVDAVIDTTVIDASSPSVDADALIAFVDTSEVP
ncbi:MAG: hypothetical protein AAF548_07445 [Actinomycetota bacterium]